MYFEGFKTAVTINFAILAVIGMVLINIVVTLLWQQHMISFAVNQARLSLVSMIDSRFTGCEILGVAPVAAGMSQTGEVDFSFIDVVIYTGVPPENINPADKVLQEALRQSAISRKEVIQSSGNTLSLPGMRAAQISVAVPVSNCDGIEAIGRAVHFPEISRNIFDKQPVVWLYIFINTIILTVLWFFRMRMLIFKPLDNLVGMSDSFGIISSEFGDISSKRNEFGQLASALRNMLTRIEEDKEKLKATVSSLEDANKQILANQNVLVEAEKFAAVGRLSAGLAHEIGNPLGIIQGYIELLGRDDLRREDRGQYCRRAEKELHRVTRMIRQLLDLARKERDGQFLTSVPPVIHELVEMLRLQKNTATITFNTYCEDFSEKVLCSESDLHQVLLNCILNSIDALQELDGKEGTIDVSCRLLLWKTSQFAEIVIEDDGSGIHGTDISLVFDPFFTTKEVGRGTGLGLSVSRSIIENWGGTIKLESSKTIGTRVVILLPVE